ncbi:hypothetical protein LQ327_20945 [Actinomycetospora endophytica]|uniref:Secreted protein n=1 Tax=Actinomycetospora endophytica TaxID=2291215 RepID=A0ABS8PCG3_9PSEU|nr:hypothetical protein [Actinomycetospora endophytica]MCD2195844.1 hypothetical protein [Actinomycetospora endophytica]
MISMVVVWACLGGALVAVLVLVALRMGRKPGPGEDPGSRSGGVDHQAPRSAGLDPDDEKVAFADRRRYPASKWDPAPDDPDDPDEPDEDDRAAADRTRHPSNRWESD